MIFSNLIKKLKKLLTLKMAQQLRWNRYNQLSVLQVGNDA